MIQLIPGGFLKAVVEDTSPQLGGDLDGQSIYDLVDMVDGTFSGIGTFGGLVVDTDTIYVDYTNHRIGVRNSVPLQAIDVKGGSIAIDGSGVSVDFIATAYGSFKRGGLSGKSARGTRASPTATQDNDILLFFGGKGYGASEFGSYSDAAVVLRAAENMTNSAHGSSIHLEVTRPGATTRLSVQRAYWDHIDYQVPLGDPGDNFGLRFKTTAEGSDDKYHKSGIFAVDNGLAGARNDLYLCVDGASDSGNVAITDVILKLTQNGGETTGTFDVTGDLTAGTIKADDGFTGSFKDFDGRTVTVVGGIITGVA